MLMSKTELKNVKFQFFLNDVFDVNVCFIGFIVVRASVFEFLGLNSLG